MPARKPLPQLVAHVMASLDRTGRCWLWRRSLNNRGYGHMTVRYRKRLVHRLVYEWTFGEIPPGHEVLHACDTPACCNPAHLRAGTHVENMRDMVRKWRGPLPTQTHCKRGHEFTLENTRWTAKGRSCRECQNAARRKPNGRGPYRPRILFPEAA